MRVLLYLNYNLYVRRVGGGGCKNVCKIVKCLKIFSFVTLWLTTLDISEVVEAQKEITQRCKSNKVIHSDLTNEAICAIQTC